MFAYAGERQEVHASPWSAEIKGHWVNFHVTTTHVCDLPVWGQECLQRFQGNHCYFAMNSNWIFLMRRPWTCHVRPKMTWTPGKLPSSELEFILRRAMQRELQTRERWVTVIILQQYHYNHLGQKYLFFFQFKNYFFPFIFQGIGKNCKM